IHKNVTNILSEKFVYPVDIIKALQKDEETWRNFQNFSESYKRIRVAYIHDARARADEFEKRLRNFLTKTGQNKKIIGHGGIDKYY
ncbi:MAG: YdeI/OmpD-associated family protein, partial [Bacteroidia bacterium]|nr:YdeI/OmpD-associated family protein [Bacteroidia bacterium]